MGERTRKEESTTPRKTRIGRLIATTAAAAVAASPFVMDYAHSQEQRRQEIAHQIDGLQMKLDSQLAPVAEQVAAAVLRRAQTTPSALDDSHLYDGRQIVDILSAATPEGEVGHLRVSFDNVAEPQAHDVTGVWVQDVLTGSDKTGGLGFSREYRLQRDTDGHWSATQILYRGDKNDLSTQSVESYTASAGSLAESLVSPFTAHDLSQAQRWVESVEEALGNIMTGNDGRTPTVQELAESIIKEDTES